MVKLYDIIKANSTGKGESTMWQSVDIISEFLTDKLSENDMEELSAKIYGVMSGGHYNEEFAAMDVKKMYYLDKSNRRHAAPYWTEPQIHTMYERVRGRISSQYNFYDFYVTFNMIASDNWCLIQNWWPSITNEEILNKVCDLTVNWLSDEDWPTTSKIWDYLHK